MRQSCSNLVWPGEFTPANTPEVARPRKIDAGKAAIQKALVLTTESIQEFEALYSVHYNHHQPQGELESSLVNDIATAHWRIRQMQRAETETINGYLIVTSNAPGTVAKALISPTVCAIGREEERCSIQMLRGIAALRKIKINRKQTTK